MPRNRSERLPRLPPALTIFLHREAVGQQAVGAAPDGYFLMHCEIRSRIRNEYRESIGLPRTPLGLSEQQGVPDAPDPYPDAP